jgi:DNA polymerase-3 subunit epsilon
MRQIVLDTETTGLEPADGHRVIEIGALELNDRRPTQRHFHYYLNPDRAMDPGALEVHGITSEFLADKPRFADIVDEFLNFIDGADLVIHNAPFDVGFLDSELALLGSERGRIADYASITDSLQLARRLHPGMKNSLDALCRRYQVDNTRRTLHGALLDAEILTEVYLLMTGGQTSLSLEHAAEAGPERSTLDATPRAPLVVRRATEQELADHQRRLERIQKASGGNCHWLNDFD